MENRNLEFNYENWDLVRLSDHLGKYIVYKKDYYSLVIHKNDWDGHDNAWIAYYAKEKETSFSIQKPLIKVTGSTLHRVLINMAIAYNKFKDEKKGNPDFIWKL